MNLSAADIVECIMFVYVTKRDCCFFKTINTKSNKSFFITSKSLSKKCMNARFRRQKMPFKVFVPFSGSYTLKKNILRTNSINFCSIFCSVLSKFKYNLWSHSKRGTIKEKIFAYELNFIGLAPKTS